MIALIASAVLGLYVFLPDFLFGRLAIPFVALKKHQRTKIEEVAAGITVALIPFVLTYLLSRYVWFFGHWPFPINEPTALKITDYKTVISAAYSEAYFQSNYAQFWNALAHVWTNQLRFLIWNYTFLGLEIGCVVLSTVYFGSWRRYRLYRIFIGAPLLRRASHWYVLFTPFMFPRKAKPRVMVDVMTMDDHLYDGEIADFFVDAHGNLLALLLKGFRRFRFEHFEQDRKANKAVKSSDYWKDIPGANFLIPYDKIANINIRYELPDQVLIKNLEALLKQLEILPSKVTIKAGTGFSRAAEQPAGGSIPQPPETTK